MQLECKQSFTNFLIFQACYLLGKCPRWSSWTEHECDPWCYKPDEKKVDSFKKLTRECKPKWHKISCDTLSGYSETFKKCSDKEIPKCPDMLKKIVLKNSAQSWSSDDYMFLQICNPMTCCNTELNSPSNDFGSGNTDTFTASDFQTDGDCYNFNITRLISLEIKRKSYGGDEENWLGEYMILKSDNPDIKYRCTFDVWIPPNEISVPIKCQPMSMLV